MELPRLHGQHLGILEPIKEVAVPGRGQGRSGHRLCPADCQVIAVLLHLPSIGITRTCGTPLRTVSAPRPGGRGGSGSCGGGRSGRWPRSPLRESTGEDTTFSRSTGGATATDHRTQCGGIPVTADREQLAVRNSTQRLVVHSRPPPSRVCPPTLGVTGRHGSLPQ